MNRRTKIIFGISIIFILGFLAISFTYGFYLSKYEGNTSSGNNVSITIGGTAKVLYTDYSLMSINNLIAPGYTHTKNFSIKNLNNQSATYSIYLMEVNNTFTRSEDVTYVLYRTNNNELPLEQWDVVSSGVYPKTDALLVANESLKNSDDMYYYIFKVSYNKSDDAEQNIDMGSTFSGKIQISGTPYELNRYDSNTLAYNILNNALNGSNGTVYKNSPRSIPGKEVPDEDEKILTTSVDDFSTSYYFRGNVTNNFLEMNNSCFRIVRIQGDGTIKLILENEGSCNGNSSNTDFIGKYNFNSENLFDSSQLFEILNNWYNEKGFTNTVQTYWCNNNVVSDSFNPSLKCLDNKVIGNVGTLTIDEMAFAGNMISNENNNNNTNYLTQNRNIPWWSLNGYNSQVYILNGLNGITLKNPNDNEINIRPSIVLDKNTKYLSGDGTKTNPYRVK